MMIDATSRMWVSGVAAVGVAALGLVGLVVWPQDGDARLLRAAPGAAFHDCAAGPPACPEMIMLPVGSFTMGARPGGDDYETERPPQRITLAALLAISKYEIKFGEWRACVAAGGCAAVSVPGANEDIFPAANMTFEEANQYAAWLSNSTGKSYRLPSEAEWEYAARGVTSVDAPYTEYWWGDQAPACNIGARDGANTGDCGFGRAQPVGSYQANPFGLFDVAGNVWEWTQDCFRPVLDGQPANAGPVLTGDCSQRVVRGGSWVARSDISRAADRSHAGDRDTAVGFRVVRVVETP